MTLTKEQLEETCRQLALQLAETLGEIDRLRSALREVQALADESHRSSTNRALKGAART